MAIGLVAALLSLILHGCGGVYIGPDFYDLTIRFTEMDPYAGRLFELRIVSITSRYEMERYRLEEIETGEFVLSFAGTIFEDETYKVDFYVDVDSNGSYDPPPDDHAWRLEIDTVHADVEMTFSRNTDFTDIEWPY